MRYDIEAQSKWQSEYRDVLLARTFAPRMRGFWAARFVAPAFLVAWVNRFVADVPRQLVRAGQV